MKRTVATFIVSAAFAAPAHALAAPTMAAPVGGVKAAQAGTNTTTSSSTTTTTPVRLTQNEQADRRALNAYATYLSAVLAQEATAELDDTTFTATISDQCKAALAPLTQPPDEVNGNAQHTLTVLGEEMGDDLSINFDLAAFPAFTKFAGALTRLHWRPMSGAALVVKHYVTKETAVLNLTTSNLCLDATDAQLKPAVVPDATKTFIKSYDDASDQANSALGGMMTLLQTYEVPGEKATISRIATLANALSTVSKSDLLQAGTTLSNVLESN